MWCRRVLTENVWVGLGPRFNAVLRSGVLLIAAGVAFAVAGGVFLPGLIAWLFAAMLVWGGFTVMVREHQGTLRKAFQGWHFQQPKQPQRPKLRPGEVYDRSVRLTQVANVPLAELMCSRLRANGIEAFYKGTSPFGGSAVGIADMNPALPAEVWVGEHHLDQARGLIEDRG